jgi:alpha-amylase
MRSRIFIIALLCIFGALKASAAPAPRTVFVQLFEWPWNDVAEECENYLGPNGFAAVAVSPPNEHLSLPNHPWWERYQPVSYEINSRGGTEEEFQDMVLRCKKAGVDVYADAVINHMTAQKNGVGFAGTNFEAYKYPGLYNYSDFHHCGRYGDDGIRDYEDTYELHNCNLLGLQDLDTGSFYVQNTLAGYMNRLLSMGVKGFRIDAAKHMFTDDIHAILAKLDRPAYIYQEVLLGPTDRLPRKDYLKNGDITVFSYPFSMGSAFKNRILAQLPNMIKEDVDSSDAVVFLQNHDLERWGDQSNLLTYGKDLELYRLAQVFMLTWPYGYPQLFSGYTFKDFDQGPPLGKDNYTLPVMGKDGRCKAPWTCEHRLPEIAPLVKFRNETNAAFYVSKWWSNGKDQIAYSRGPLGFVVINASSTPLRSNLKTELAPGEYCNLLDNRYIKAKNCAKGAKVDENHVMAVEVAPNSAVVYLWNETP